MYIFNNNKGFTVLECVIAISLFLFVVIICSNILIYISRITSRVIIQNEYLENARFAIEFMSNRIQIAEEITLQTIDDSNTLRFLTVRYHSDDILESNIFEYIKGTNFSDTKYNRLDFGGNEVAVYISDFKVTKNEDILNLTLIMDNIDDNINEIFKMPIVINKKINIKYKTFLEI